MNKCYSHNTKMKNYGTINTNYILYIVSKHKKYEIVFSLLYMNTLES